MATKNLPIELWLVVFSFTKALNFSSNDLAALCQVSIGFHHAAVNFLYESITVDNSDVCTTLAECPHLAIKVKSFVFTYPTMIVFHGPEVHLDNLTLALKNMSCLSTLKLIHSQMHHSSVLRYCDAKLRIFHCTYNIDRRLLSFLVKQDDIRDLAITADPILDLTVFFELSEILPPTSLPHLSEISASLCFLRILVPGRPVHTVRFKSYHSQFEFRKWGLDDVVDHSTVPVRNLVLDLTIWHLPVLHSRALLPKHVEEITLTGFSGGRPFAVGGPKIIDWGIDVHLILASAPSLKRLTFWIEGECEDGYQWARLLFQEFHDKLSRLEQVSCVTNGPDMSTSFDFFEENMGCLAIGPHEDNRTRGHRAANDIRELMQVPVLCCRTEKELCHRKTNVTLQLNRRLMERWMKARTDYPDLRWLGSVRGPSD